MMYFWGRVVSGSGARQRPWEDAERLTRRPKPTIIPGPIGVRTTCRRGVSVDGVTVQLTPSRMTTLETL